MIGYFVLLVYCLVYFLCQSESVKTLAITDVNNYLYIAKLMADGKILYRDIFLDNFPLAAYVAFFYRTITFGDMNAFRLTGTIEALVLTWLIYKHEFNQSKNTFISLLATGTFCCSLRIR